MPTLPFMRYYRPKPPSRIGAVLAVGVFTLLFAVGCELDTDDIGLTKTDSSYTAHVAFSGGGWRAHTGHSVLTMALLKNGTRTLEEVFAHVGAISSNSGGSWFSTMLMYSDKFADAIEQPRAAATWATPGSGATGWLGLQQNRFDASDCHELTGDGFLACVMTDYWKNGVENTVFGDFPIEVTMNGKRAGWATKKHYPLLLATTLLTQNVVLNSFDFGTRRYYNACLPGLIAPPARSTDEPACEPEKITAGVIPGTFSNVRVPFFPSLAWLGGSDTIAVTYNEYDSSKPPKPLSTSIQNPESTGTVPVMIAAAASSAAAGIGASEKVTGSWFESYELEDAALSFTFSGSDVAYKSAEDLTLSELEQAKMVRLADGGPADNSGVAQLVSFLQQEGSADGFNIVAFDIVQEPYSHDRDTAVGIDIAYLFGKGLTNGNEFCSGLHGGGHCVTVPNLQIFQTAPLQNTSSTWEAPENHVGKLDHRLIYTQYDVTTVDNRALNVASGTKGTLHAFTVIWSDADSAPQNSPEKDATFEIYKQMLDFISHALQDGSEGLGYLERAFGLSS